MASDHLILYAARLAQEVDGVIDYLRNYSWRITRHNLCQYPERYTLSWSSPGQPDVGVHWLHSLVPFSTARSLIGLEREISLKECLAFWEGVWACIPESHWLNSPRLASIASNKLLQLQRASQMGLNVPDSIVTNSANDLSRFAYLHHDIVLKSLSSGFVQYGPRSFKFYTRRATSHLLSRLDQSQFGPIMAQRRIAKRYEIRATVVNDSAFCCLVDYSKLPDVVDYRCLDFEAHRNAFSGCPQELIDLVARPSVKMTMQFGLRFGAIDWVLDQSETPFFLELNPTPSFKWFELNGAGNITAAIAELLLNFDHDTK